MVMVVLLPIVLNNFIYFLLSKIIEHVNDIGVTDSMISPMVLALTGLMAYVADALCLPECLAVVMTAVSIKFTLKLFSFQNLFLTKYGTS